MIRVRPDGSDLQVVSTGERNPLSAMLTATDEVFTYGNDDDSKKWPNSLTHHVVGGHYGYPYEFLLRPERCLPIVAGQLGGSGTQGIIYKGDGLPARYRGNLFICDWGLQTVFRVEVAPSGATFRMTRREPFVTAGDVADFRPFSIAPSADGPALYVVDWGVGNWLLAGVADRPALPADLRRRPTPSRRPRSPRSLDVDAPRPPEPRRPAPRPAGAGGQGEAAVGAAGRPAARTTASGTQGRLHALWALDAIGTPEAVARRSATRWPTPIRSSAPRPPKRAGIRQDARGAAGAGTRCSTTPTPSSAARRRSPSACSATRPPARP